jgi:hypothetical protein
MPGLADNPFAALTIVVAPAILTNASSVLCLGTGNRIARVVDRTRTLRAELAILPVHSDRRPGYMLQLSRLTARAQLLLQAMQWFYASIGAFAAAALVSIVGTLFARLLGEAFFLVTGGLSLVAGTVGVSGLVVGCTMMVRETQLAVRFLDEEADLSTPADEAAV